MSVDPASRGWNEHRHRWDVPAGTIQTVDLADGSVTTPKIVNGAVGTSQLAAGAAQQQLAAVQTTTAWSTTTVGAWLAVTPLTTASVACSGALLRIEAVLSLTHTVAGATVYTGVGLDGTTPASVAYTMSQMTIPGASYALPVAWTWYVTPTVGNHTFGVFAYNANAGTLTLLTGALASLYVTEQRR